MPDFSYQAMDRTGKKRKGKIKAIDRNSAVQLLREQGMYTLKMTEIPEVEPWYKKEIHIGAKVKTKDFAIFCRQLATLIRAGVTILDSVRVLSEQSESKALRKALVKLTGKLAEGNQLSAATAESPDIFPKIFTNMVRAGEAAGNLDVILERVALFFEREYYTREKIKSAMTYPILVGIISIIVTVFMLVDIVPTFVGIFASMHVQLPLPTRIVLATSHFMIADWWIILSVVVVMIVLHLLGRRSMAYLLLIDRMKFRIPVFGQLTQKSVVARMARTMGSLFASAVPVLQSLNIVSEVVDNRLVGKVLAEAAVSLQEGGRLAEPLRKSKLFPPIVSHMVAIGEETGNLDFMLDKIADFYEAEVETMTDRLKTLIEPLMMIVLAVVVGTIVSAVVLPEFSLYSNLH